MAFVLVMIVFMVANLTIVSLSQNSLPGEPLYRTKRLLEEVTLATTLDNAEVAQLNINFVRRRLDEVESLVIKGRYEEVDQIVNEYEQQVNQTIDTIDQVAAVDTLTAQRLARQLEAILALSRTPVDPLECWRAQLCRPRH